MFWIAGRVFFYERIILHQSMETQLITRYETMDCLTVYFINTNISQLLQHVIIVNTDTILPVLISTSSKGRYCLL